MTRMALLSALALAAGLGEVARGDSITSGGLPANNVTIDKIEGDTISYKTASGTPTSKTITDKLKINITDEPSLNEAEDAYVAGKWSDATDGYVKTLKSTNKPWLKDFAALRLMVTADKANRFDAAIVAWLSMLERDPKVAGAHKPKLPADPASSYLRTSLTQLDSAAASERNVDKITAIRAMELEIARTMKDDKKVTELAADLSKNAFNGSPGSNTAETVQAVVEGQLGLIKVALDKQDYAGAQQKLEQVKASVIDPTQEADWLWLKAEATAGPLADSKDAPALQDAALNYMRLVASFPNNAKVPQALLKTAELLEKCNDKPTAQAVYQSVVRDYASQPAGKEAQSHLDKLKGAGAP